MSYRFIKCFLWSILAFLEIHAASVVTSNKAKIVVTSIDFQNTQTIKPCLIATLKADITINIHGETYKVAIPENSDEISTSGSYCDRDFKSFLALNFHGIQLNILFARDAIIKHSSKMTYCDRCDVGSWTITNFQLLVSDWKKLNRSLHLPPLQAEASSADISSVAGPVKSGINLHRSYQCSNKKIDVQFHVKNNSTGINVQISFSTIMIQPFLISDQQYFSDPQFCDNVWLAHILVILLPALYFIIFLLINHYRNRIPCLSVSTKPVKVAVVDEAS